MKRDGDSIFLYKRSGFKRLVMTPQTCEDTIREQVALIATLRARVAMLEVEVEQTREESSFWARVAESARESAQPRDFPSPASKVPARSARCD